MRVAGTASTGAFTSCTARERYAYASAARSTARNICRVAKAAAVNAKTKGAFSGKIMVMSGLEVRVLMPTS